MGQYIGYYTVPYIFYVREKGLDTRVGEKEGSPLHIWIREEKEKKIVLEEEKDCEEKEYKKRTGEEGNAGL